MGIEIKPSDLYFKYYHKKETRDQPKFTGKPDSAEFDRNDLYEVLPMFAAVMDHFETNDQAVLHKLEEIVIYNLPQSIRSREDVFDCLVASIEQLLES
ncbi:MAG: hypothetical protein C0623_06420 [Desulfuromonas sp.]|nr:MAG: hypothetical protein C0623_06420 [Desulfuromonas sp.]